MKAKLDKLIVVDIEATCWEPEPSSNALEYQSEIIEVGICVLDLVAPTDDLFNRTQKKSIIVKPQHSKVSEFCTKLTTLTQADVDQGISLAEACKIIKEEYRAEQYTWASYGDYDLNQFKSECKSKNIAFPFGRRHVNIKNILALLNRWEKEIGLPAALNRLGWEMDGTLHRGVDDAWNIAKLARRVFFYDQ